MTNHFKPPFSPFLNKRKLNSKDLEDAKWEKGKSCLCSDLKGMGAFDPRVRVVVFGHSVCFKNIFA